MTKPRVGLLLSVVLLAPTVVYADDNHPEFTGAQTGPNEWTYTLKFVRLVNYSVFPVATSKTNLTTITVTGLFGVFAAAGPTSTDFPGNLNTVNLDWSASVLDGGTKVVYTHVGPGTGNFSDLRHAFGFTIHASGAANGTVALVTSGFSRDTSRSLADGTFNLDIKGTTNGPVNPRTHRWSHQYGTARISMRRIWQS
jgi:hypothetical protein